MTLAEPILKRGRPRDTAKDEAILLAAGDLFMEHGYEAVSLDAVAQRAGVSKATIYARYADKDALFAAVLRQECERAVSLDSFSPDPNQSVRDTLIVLATRFLDLVTGEKAMQMNRVLVAETARAPRMAELFYETAVLTLKNRFAAWLRAETVRGRLNVRDPDGAAWRYLGGVKGEAHLRASFGLPPIEPERLKTHIEDAADEFIRAHAP
ncbi:TetR/AcrR family transcriptional regulator [Brevundimonas bacteroides]|uniref:TetR/AcrR family transcriptional regulator n=1 Tax=Brevundimonas bacteroides TaxID=74311 RepID=UPI000494E922|nr:TetR/AcrR family transcriptional regulator [Brevundimonas bacteroides]